MRKPRSRITIPEYYERYAEGERLERGLGQLEFARVTAILQRFLPPAPARVIDVGGGTGPYALWLARRGYEVHLVDPSPRLLEQAIQASQQPEGPRLASFTVGDARSLGFSNRSADAVLMFGPLYHLTEKDDRHLALVQAHRVLRHNGPIFVAAISRFASVVDGLVGGRLRDPVFAETAIHDLASGQHRNPTGDLSYVTDAFFHLPSELREEIENAGFSFERLLAVEGLASLVSDFDDVWQNPDLRRRLLDIIELTQEQEAVLGVSMHLVAVARKTTRRSAD
jgi:ubiquinone/menaquinone biosynthesis C-methylase UbiE